MALDQVGNTAQESLKISCSDLSQNRSSEEQLVLFVFFLEKWSNLHLISRVWFEPYPKCKSAPIFYFIHIYSTTYLLIYIKRLKSWLSVMLLFFYTCWMVYRSLKKSINSSLLRKYLQYRADMQEIYQALLRSSQIEDKINIWSWKMEKTKDRWRTYHSCLLWFKVNMSS